MVRKPRQTTTLAFKTALGWVGLAAVENGSKATVCRIIVPCTSRRQVEHELKSLRNPQSAVRKSPPRTSSLSSFLREARTQLEEFLAGKRRDLDIPVDLSEGTSFQRQVWRALHRIPYGRVRSYKWVAERVGGSRYARAVGMALGANPVPLVIPCHRVVAHDGSLGGFTGGLGTKRKLLGLEGVLPRLRRGKGHS